MSVSLACIQLQSILYNNAYNVVCIVHIYYTYIYCTYTLYICFLYTYYTYVLYIWILTCILYIIGASDRILAGQSTFFVELAETAVILKSATKVSAYVYE